MINTKQEVKDGTEKENREITIQTKSYLPRKQDAAQNDIITLPRNVVGKSNKKKGSKLKKLYYAVKKKKTQKKSI